MSRVHNLWRLMSPVTGVALLVAGVILLWPHTTSAQYVQNNLIADNIFLNANSMSQAQIQAFLTNRGGYLARYQLVFDCASTGTASNNAYVAAGAPCGQTVYASAIIYYAAQVYGLNPQAIMATLQKEQSLITATNPTSSQLNFAMGYGCADSTGCASNSGFLHQVDDATWQFRMNYERAWGNNSWWNTTSRFACSGATKYYSTGLYPGRNVTFYDDYGTGYTSFVINDGATSSLYCYTPHAYPGSSSEYYSGSYNFVTAFENWFGSTQPAVELTSSMSFSTDASGKLYTDRSVTAKFTLTNTTNAAVDIGQIGVAGYDSANNNVGYPLRAVTIPAHGSYTYSETQILSKEDTYHFWITDYNNGAWSSTYPTSADIDYVRDQSIFVQAMPQLTTQASFSPTDQRVGRNTTVSFTIHNPSQQAADLGKVGLAVYGPDGGNYGFPVASVTIPAGGDYTYTASQAWKVPGQYSAFLTSTQDNGVTWDSTIIETTVSTQKQFNFTVGNSPTLTQSPALSIASPHVGQQVTASFVVHNYADQALAAGKIALAIYGPQGQNVGLALSNLAADSNSDFVYQQNTAFWAPGTYTAWITYTPDNGRTWDNTAYPNPETANIARKITFTVLPSPTVTVQPTLSVASPRAGQQVTATFTIKNYGDTAVYVGKTGLAAYDTSNHNVGFSLEDITVPANSTYTYSEPNTFNSPGQYTAWITVTRDNGRTWDDTTYPAADSGSVQRRVSFTVLPSPTLTQSPTLSIASPHVGQQVTASFVVHNYADQALAAGKIALAIYGPQGQNVGLALAPLAAASNGDFTYQQNTTFTTPGTYTAWITYTPDNGRTWDDTTYPAADSGSVQRRVSFTVLP